MAVEPSDAVGTRLMFENDRVKVWDQVIPPGEICETHIHKTDYFYVIVEGGLIRFTDTETGQYREIQFHDDQVRFHDIDPATGKIDNRLVNAGKNTHRAIVVELKN